MLYQPNYANALRCIGQALRSRNVDLFELTAEAGEFFVQCGDPNPPHTALLKLKFSPNIIKILDREGQALRRDAGTVFRFDSVPEVLRATGRYLDAMRAQLHRLSNCTAIEAGDVEVEYQTRSNGAQSEILAMSRIRETAVEMYKRRNHMANSIDILTRKN